jgi:hypothetical protein
MKSSEERSAPPDEKLVCSMIKPLIKKKRSTQLAPRVVSQSIRTRHYPTFDAIDSSSV